MLDQIMRRFGVGADGLTREPTYAEKLLEHTLTRAKEALSASEHGPVVTIARTLLEAEANLTTAKVPELDTSASLAGARNYLLLVTDNDRLPPAGQLTAEELTMTRELLMSARGGARAAEQSDRVLSLLEEKFNDGKFPQASLLLRLFETTPARRRNNERTLFYEEMISRFGVARLHRIPSSMVRKFHKAVNAEKDAATRLVQAASWLAQHAGVHLNLLMQRPDEREAWQSAVESVEDARARRAALAILPPPRWRNLVEYLDFGLVSAFREHLDQNALSEYFSILLRACYFIVLVTGKTGFESFIQDFFSWVLEFFGLHGARLLPDLHKRTTIGEAGLENSIREIEAQQLAKQQEIFLSNLSDESVEESIEALANLFCEIDPNDIPPGEYNVTGLLLDHLVKFQTEEPTVMLRVHRLC